MLSLNTPEMSRRKRVRAANNRSGDGWCRASEMAFAGAKMHAADVVIACLS
jgi:hypothetical protein